MSTEKLDRLQQMIDSSRHTVILCGSGILEEHGLKSLKDPDYAFDIEEEYRRSPEYLFSTGYFNNRPEQFYRFYRREFLAHLPQPGPAAYNLAALERSKKVKCIVTANVYDLERQAGCKNVISLHGTVYNYQCAHCRQPYSIDYIQSTPEVPRCPSCGHVIRPGLLLFGEILDSQLMTRTTIEIENADTLLVLGTTLDSEVFSNYIKYFMGRNLAVIHQTPHYLDSAADLVMLESPWKVIEALRA